jgi:hypothetical protein
MSALLLVKDGAGGKSAETEEIAEKPRLSLVEVSTEEAEQPELSLASRDVLDEVRARMTVRGFRWD